MSLAAQASLIAFLLLPFSAFGQETNNPLQPVRPILPIPPMQLDPAQQSQLLATNDRIKKEIQALLNQRSYGTVRSADYPGITMIVPASPDLKPEFILRMQELAKQSIVPVQRALDQCARGPLQCATVPVNRELTVFFVLGTEFDRIYQTCYPTLAAKEGQGTFAFTYKNYCFIPVPSKDDLLPAIVHEPGHARYFLWLVERYGNRATDISHTIFDPARINPFIQEGIATLGEPSAIAKAKGYMERAIAFAKDNPQRPSLPDMLKYGQAVFEDKNNGMRDPKTLYSYSHAIMLFLLTSLGVNLEKITDFDMARIACEENHAQDRNDQRRERCLNNALTRLLGNRSQDIERQFQEWLARQVP